MTNNLIYEASVYHREVSYRNFKQEEKSATLFFALDPMQLMQVIASFEPKKNRSNNPALKDQAAPVSDEQQIKFVRDLVIKAAGSPSEDGESWIPFTDFENTLVGKAFLTKLTASDGDRREFSEKVILNPFKAFVGYAESDESNTPAEVQQLKRMLVQLEQIFAMPDPEKESVEDRRARLEAELNAMQADATAPTGGPIPLPKQD